MLLLFTLILDYHLFLTEAYPKWRHQRFLGFYAMVDLFTELPFGLPGKIYRSPMPYGDFDPDQRVMELYQQNNVEVIVMLVSDKEGIKKTGHNLVREYKARGFEVISLPIPDFSIPDEEKLRKELKKVHSLLLAGQTVAVHCNAGIGRTGLFMACLARRVMGCTGNEAVSWVRQYIPHAVENEDQMKMVIGLRLEE
jgi:protein-tyrosine phosphatase